GGLGRGHGRAPAGGRHLPPVALPPRGQGVPDRPARRRLSGEQAAGPAARSRLADVGRRHRGPRRRGAPPETPLRPPSRRGPPAWAGARGGGGAAEAGLRPPCRSRGPHGWRWGGVAWLRGGWGVPSGPAHQGLPPLPSPSPSPPPPTPATSSAPPSAPLGSP